MLVGRYVDRQGGKKIDRCHNIFSLILFTCFFLKS
jgi:hypothetical protein